MDNPFIIITSTGNEDVVDRVEERIDTQMYINEIINEGGILLIKGDPGVGKSTIINWIVNDVKKTQNLDVIKDTFTPAMLAKIKGLSIRQGKKLLIILDDFNNVILLNKSQQADTINVLNMLANNKVGVIVIDNRADKQIDKMMVGIKAKMHVMSIKGLKDEDIKRIIINRLNEVRKVKSDSLSPFTEEEISKILKRVRGNVRAALLICAALYDTKQEKLV
ncbi:MAG: hypothetical protein RAK22_01590 [Nanoarchaeota archaeon]|nr:hypothetical protein [Nanoarchaeota archaeon]